MVDHAHQWRLVGPWYRWNTLPEDPGQKKTSRPIIQKYADSHHVEAFLQNPQRSLRFLEEDAMDSGRRKVFLDTHERFYLVTCELHCDTPGFPKVARDQVCEAGFVIRKRKTEVDDAIRDNVETLLHKMAFERSRLRRIQAKRDQYLKRGVNTNPVTQLFSQTIENVRSSSECKIQNRLADNVNQLKTAVAEHPVRHSVQAWHSTGNGLGYWHDQSDELPQQLEEQVYPLYPLIADHTDAGHASGHQTIWYGLLPVGALERDPAGNPIFDDKSSYEVRCFVRRHQQKRKKTNERHDCCGEIVWSRPTEAYQIASHFDLVGTSNRLTIIQAPDLGELAQQVGSPNFKIGQGLGLGVATPAGSGLPIEVDSDGQPSAGNQSGLPSICFFAIPLITIIALFVLRLFLPIVVFLFGLWFLLRLKLCILPQISVDLGVDLELGLEGDLGVEADVSVEVAVKMKNDVLPQLVSGMRDYFNAEIAAGGQREQQAYRDLAQMALDQSTDFSSGGLAPELIREIESMVADNPSLGVESSGASTLPNPQDRLAYYPTKQLSEVFA